MNNKTRYGVYIRINNELTEYYYKLNNLQFYFSSPVYRDKFIEKVQDFITQESNKFENKYNVMINFSNIFSIILYKMVEKRGFSIYDIETGNYLEQYGVFYDKME